MPLKLPRPVLKAQESRMQRHQPQAPVMMAGGGELQTPDNWDYYSYQDSALGMGQMPYGSRVVYGSPEWVWNLPYGDPRHQEALDVWNNMLAGNDWQSWGQYNLPQIESTAIPEMARGGILDASTYTPDIGDYAGMGNIAPPTPGSDAAQYFNDPYGSMGSMEGDFAAENYASQQNVDTHNQYADWAAAAQAARDAAMSGYLGAQGAGQATYTLPPELDSTIQGMGDMRYGEMPFESYQKRAEMRAETYGLDPEFAYITPARPELMDAAGAFSAWGNYGDLPDWLGSEFDPHIGISPDVVNYNYKMPTTMLHEQMHALNYYLTDEERAQLNALMEQYPTVSTAMGLGSEEYHPGESTRYIDEAGAWGNQPMAREGLNVPSAGYFPEPIADYINSILPDIIERSRSDQR